MQEELKSGASSSRKKVGVHPLAIASICDHYTRVAAGGSTMASDSPVIGLLFGIQNGLDISIIDATDAIYEVVGGEVVLNVPAIDKKKSLFTAVYAKYELLGWYTLTKGNQVLPSHMFIHRNMMTFNEAPLFLLMDYAPEPDAEQLPLSIYEAEMHIIKDTATQIFVDLPFKLETSQAERVAVDQITKLTPTEGISTLELQNQSLTTSLRILEGKIALIAKLVEDMHEGLIPVDHKFLRNANKIYQQIPAIDSGTFEGQFLNELVDTLIMTYLSAATDATSSLTELTDSYSLVYGASMRRNL